MDETLRMCGICGMCGMYGICGMCGMYGMCGMCGMCGMNLNLCILLMLEDTFSLYVAIICAFMWLYNYRQPSLYRHLIQRQNSL